ncbi:hypothetical protein AVEN_113265-1 [Araneus ventricosus]|uniref:Uncharacterized protein n=1 Tax=Araneus ventricosus TaxID=182803 RepID=A0A4Y2K1J9_ARAVE|nr:hypothetical protein AVEN_113265-1 [Araneus ventricosus]
MKLLQKRHSNAPSIQLKTIFVKSANPVQQSPSEKSESTRQKRPVSFPLHAQNTLHPSFSLDDPPRIQIILNDREALLRRVEETSREQNTASLRAKIKIFSES